MKYESKFKSDKLKVAAAKATLHYSIKTMLLSLFSDFTCILVLEAATHSLLECPHDYCYREAKTGFAIKCETRKRKQIWLTTSLLLKFIHVSVHVSLHQTFLPLPTLFYFHMVIHSVQGLSFKAILKTRSVSQLRSVH